MCDLRNDSQILDAQDLSHSILNFPTTIKTRYDHKNTKVIFNGEIHRLFLNHCSLYCFKSEIVFCDLSSFVYHHGLQSLAAAIFSLAKSILKYSAEFLSFELRPAHAQFMRLAL